MKRVLALVLLLIVAVMPVCAHADGYEKEEELQVGQLLYVCNTAYAPMYADYNTRYNTTIEYLSFGEPVIYLTTTDRGYYVVHGNNAGYVPANFLSDVNYYGKTFPLPGTGWLTWDETQATPTPTPTPTPKPTATPTPKPATTQPLTPSNVNHIEFTGIAGVPNKDLWFRSGPGTTYSEHGRPDDNSTFVLRYQVYADSHNWVAVDFYKNQLKYRLYTTLNRFDYYDYLPAIQEITTKAYIKKSCATYYGPGYDYAVSKLEVKKNTFVTAVVEENGWILVDCSISGGMRQRGWVPPEYWY